MSSFTTQLGLLALVSGALAVPGYGHGSHHHHHYSGKPMRPTGSGAPYEYGNGTSLAGPTGTGTGAVLPASASGSTAITSTQTVTNYMTVSAYGYSSSSVSANNAAAVDTTSTCTDAGTVTSTYTNYVTVYYTPSSEVAPVDTATSSSSPQYPPSAGYTMASYNATSYGSGTGTGYASSTAGAISASGYSAYTYSAANRWHKHSHASQVPSASSSEAAPVESSTSSSSVYVAPATESTSAYVAPSTTSTSVYVAPTTSSTNVYVAPTTSSTSVYVAPATSSSVVASSTTSSAAATSSSASAVSTSGKRGCAYNDASLCDLFTGGEVTWGYNWGSSSSSLSSSFDYVPLLWGPASDFTSSWNANAKAAIDAGSSYLMSFNEPDLSSQADMTPEAAAAAYQTYMMPFAGTSVKLGSPAVTNGGGSTGLDWLSAFLDCCTDCQIDFVPIHWYDSYENTAYFQEQVQNASTITGGKPVWVTEFGTTDGSDDNISSFLETVMPWMDKQSFVERYSYYMVADGYLVNGDSPSSYGSTFLSYTDSSD